MAPVVTIHPQNPQLRLVRQVVERLREGAVIVYPTDSTYALGCRIGDKDAVERIRALRGLDKKHQFSIVCRDLTEIAVYARVDNRQFRLLKSATPGAYTFVLEAGREVPKRLQHPSRRTIGLRVPAHAVVQGLLAELGEPMISSTLQMPGDELPLNDIDEIRERTGRHVDLIVDSGACGFEATTIINLTGDQTVITRLGRGDPAIFGL